jgi:superfamily II DNA or RNA helicase
MPRISKYQKLLSEECLERSTEITNEHGGESIVLDEHQVQAMERSAAALAEGGKKFGIVHPGGAGKTVLEAGLVQASQVAKDRMIDGGYWNTKKDIVITVERSLMTGVREQLEDVLNRDIGQWGMGRKDLEPNIIVSSIQSLQRNHTTLDEAIGANNVSLILGDEADMFITQRRMAVLNQFRNAIKIGLTATPRWPDGRKISDVWGSVVDRLFLMEGIEKGINVPPMFYMYEADIDGDLIDVVGQDYDLNQLAQALKSVQIEMAISELYGQMIPEDLRDQFPTLVYTPTLATLNATRRRLRSDYPGLKVRDWQGSTSDRDLRRGKELFQCGEVDILVLCEMGGRGLDLPRARCVIDASPTLSATKLEQRHSRALRRVRPGTDLHEEGFEKPDALIAQIVPAANRFRPVTLLDVLKHWERYKPGELITGTPSGDGGGGHRPNPEIERIARRIRRSTESSRLNLIHESDILTKIRDIRMYEDIPTVDEDGFAYFD